eukprot:TRINITY_DN82158_c0_g1_i1.p1 TRINITY_DN82158_c0_g1~~TRINITY_DN82158_c0_g1_i1.p1  ORF type:complete len:412 (+),score=68.47 TRINITY_DN82158_c0_g1_i1:128-1363(+)
MLLQELGVRPSSELKKVPPFTGDWDDVTKTFKGDIVFTSSMLGMKSGRSFSAGESCVLWKGRCSKGEKVFVCQVRIGKSAGEYAKHGLDLPQGVWDTACEQVPYTMLVQEYRQSDDSRLAYAVYRRPSGFKFGGRMHRATYINLESSVTGKTQWKLDNVRMIMAQVALAIRGLHRRSVIHTDINLSNIFLGTTGSGEIMARLADLRFQVKQAVQVTGPNSPTRIFIPYQYKEELGGVTTLRHETDWGTKGYRAPIWGRLAEKDSTCSVPPAVDWWAWGMAALSLFAQLQPSVPGEEVHSQTNFDDVTSTFVNHSGLQDKQIDFVNYRCIGIDRSLKERALPELPEELKSFLRSYVLLPEDKDQFETVNYAFEDFGSSFWQDEFWGGLPWEELERQAEGDDAELSGGTDDES